MTAPLNPNDSVMQTLEEIARESANDIEGQIYDGGWNAEDFYQTILTSLTRAAGVQQRALGDVDLAIRAFGGDTWNQAACRCEPEVGNYPCEYCALHQGLTSARKALSVREGKRRRPV